MNPPGVNQADIDRLRDAFKPEPLVEELRRFVIKTPYGLSLNHRLVNEPLFGPEFNRMANLAYAEKVRALRKAEAIGEWNRCVFLHERPWRLHAFLDYCHRMTAKEYWSILSSIWADCERPWVNRRAWLDMWSRGVPGRAEFAMTGKERGELDSLLDECGGKVMVWRGAECLKHARGLAWTLDRDRAEWFARRFSRDGRGYVWEARVPRCRIFAHLTGRQEAEIVLDPRRLRLAVPDRLPA